MKHNKLIAAITVAGGVFAMSGAAHAIAPAAAAALGIVGGAVAGSAAAQANDPPAIAVVPASPTVVMGAAPAPAGSYSWTPGHYVTASDGSTVWVEGTWTPGASVTVNNYDHDGDGVLNHSDRFPNDAARS